MANPKVFVTRAIPEGGMRLLEAVCAVEVWPGEAPPPREALLERVQGAAGLLCMVTDRVDAALFDAAGPGFKVVSNLAVGFNNIDVTEATQRGVPIGNTPGVLTETTADLAFGLLVAAARRLVEGADMARAGAWTAWGPTLLLGRDVHGATLGIVGMGRIGEAMARRARGFDMKVIFSDPAGKAAGCGLDEVLAEADFVSLHVPLTQATRGLVGDRALSLMKPTAVLVNTARGEVVDTDALVRALSSGTIAAAALDVTDPEPLPPSHPLLFLPNCLVVPHLGSASLATRDRMSVMAAQNILAGLRGERLPNCVNPQVYEGKALVPR
ncbi:MAG: D-glycerate dehydrogenase [Deltaproteobacteria bacterium]|nr:D-glycerate dehydrogenase [Deltaproteobacteria bacterium]